MSMKRKKYYREARIPSILGLTHPPQTDHARWPAHTHTQPQLPHCRQLLPGTGVGD
jgi:hypothetical protein